MSAGPVRTVPRWSSATGPAAGHTATVSRPLPARLLAAARLRARRSGCGWQTVALAAHTVVLAALSGERELTTGWVAHGETVPLGVRVMAGDESWRELLRGSVAPRPDEAPYETVLDLGDGRYIPAEGSPVVLTVSLHLAPGRAELRLRHRTDVLDGAAADRVAGYYLTALARLATEPDTSCRARTLLSEEELHHQLTGMSGPERTLPDRRFHELFEEQVAVRPDDIAAVYAGRSLTYAGLNARANRIAHAVLARGLGEEAVVAVVTERNLDWMAAVIGVFKAGAAYLPVEPGAPADRMGRTLTRAGCRLVLTEPGGPGHLRQAAPAGTELLTVQDACAEGHPDTDPGLAIGPERLAYLYFTSGSTGEPKGAMCEHGGFVNHLYAKIDDQSITEGQVVAQTAPQSFDISLWQLVAALVAGGRTLIVEQEAVLDVDRYLDTIERGEVAVLQAVPSYLEVVLSRLETRPRELPALRCVSVTGEALKKELTVRWFARFPRIALMNAYGLTETSDDTNHEVMTAVPARDSVPLGPPVGNVTVYVVDERLRPVPLGAPGEIVFSGICVGRGYVNDPERTAQAFTTDPHRPGERLYRSGDFGRWLPDGKLEFLGRRDAQVKIRGFRIEIGEIENQLLRLPGVRDGAVVVVETPDAGKQLVAFESGSTEPAEALRERLARVLPGYMVPRRIERLERLPLTGNGKTDKKALRALAAELGDSGGGTGHEPPRTRTEQRLARAWAEVLKVPAEEIGRTENFFDRGGTSLTAVRLIVSMERRFTLKDLHRMPVLADLAALVDAAPET
ncbi:non-ribosomal peptide synthetase [Streptomyces sp. NEAU-Y11]|uniref:non-ribosomal peptide synthetase n=1 Tax=Streptomyces cucumeris TaxID=2962890 RepID=UPI0020C8E830|nr:amino acid adenylation domain-containing protein [Streptomyces sp. NEAU-Y11]MCP9206875.1 amino acid adenylation domain-containing protein [Streptomyces sp. NEAU-Y11]